MPNLPHSQSPTLDEAGFSLIEVLVALAILAMSAAALIGVGESHVDRLRRLEDRAAAIWVAQNYLVELRLQGGSFAAGTQERSMMNRIWQVEMTQSPTSDPDLSEVMISVIDPNSAETVTRLTGFIDTGAVQ